MGTRFRSRGHLNYNEACLSLFSLSAVVGAVGADYSILVWTSARFLFDVQGYRMGEKIRATTIERPRHYLLIVYFALLHIVQIHQSSSNLGILVFFVRN